MFNEMAELVNEKRQYYTSDVAKLSPAGHMWPAKDFLRQL
jgi:hypothetical protein